MPRTKQLAAYVASAPSKVAKKQPNSKGLINPTKKQEGGILIVVDKEEKSKKKKKVAVEEEEETPVAETTTTTTTTTTTAAPRKARRGKKAKQKMREFGNRTKPIIKPIHFQRRLRELAKEESLVSDIRFKPLAIELFQFAAEYHLNNVCVDARKACIHRGKTILSEKDVRFARKSVAPDEPKYVKKVKLSEEEEQ